MKHVCHSCPQCCAGARVCVVLSPNSHLYLPTKELAVSSFNALHKPQVTKYRSTGADKTCMCFMPQSGCAGGKDDTLYTSVI